MRVIGVLYIRKLPLRFRTASRELEPVQTLVKAGSCLGHGDRSLAADRLEVRVQSLLVLKEGVGHPTEGW